MIMKMTMTTTMAMTMTIKINKKYFFNNIQKRVITCSIDKKSYKKQKKDTLKKKLLSIIYKTKKS